MRDIFLGKPWHWALLIVICALTYAVGHVKMHVIHFNAFVLSLLGGTIVVVFLLVWTMKPGDQVTRDPLEDTAGGDPEIPGDD